MRTYNYARILIQIGYKKACILNLKCIFLVFEYTNINGLKSSLYHWIIFYFTVRMNNFDLKINTIRFIL